MSNPFLCDLCGKDFIGCRCYDVPAVIPPYDSEADWAQFQESERRFHIRNME